MPSYKDEKTGKWYCKFYYRDWTDKNRPKKKMGFRTKKESQAWERAFLDKQQDNPDMTFRSLFDLYIEDLSHRLRATTIESKLFMIQLKILPYFKDKTLASITPADIRKWQNQLMAYRNKEGNPYAQTYLKVINNQLSAMLNYAVAYYGLKENPCRKAGSMGKKNANTMLFWTREEFDQFDSVISDIKDKAIYETLYYTGIRVGELLALTKSDIDVDAGTIRINKSFSTVKGNEVIAEPKTPKSNRIIEIPSFLCDTLRKYELMLYDLQDETRIFSPNTKHYIRYALMKYAADAGVKKIRVHDLRHSHASLLIELGFSPLLIAERLGHEKIETTLTTYSHLYPNKQSQVVNALEELHK